MFLGLLAGILFALDTVVLELAMCTPAYSDNATVVFLAPYISNFLHYAFSSVWLLGYLCFKKQCRGAFAALRTRGGQIVTIANLLGGVVGMSAYVAAIHYIGPALTAAISALFPAVGALLAYVFLGEHIGWFQLFGLLVSVTGVAVLGYAPSDGGTENQVLGFLFAGICCLSWAMESVLFSYGFPKARISQSQALLLRQTLSAVFNGLVILPLLRGWKWTVSVFPDRSTVYILLGALLLTGSYLCYYKAITAIGATKAMALNITYTAWAFVFSTVLLNTASDIRSVLCGVAIVGGSLAASVNLKPEKDGKLQNRNENMVLWKDHLKE